MAATPSRNILVLSSCTGQKAHSPDDQLTLGDFQKGPKHLKAREKDLKKWLTPAQDLYTGQQHVRLRRGIDLLRSQKGILQLEFRILSAGYGIIPADRKIAPYEATFQGMKKAELRAWAKELRSADAFADLLSKTAISTSSCSAIPTSKPAALPPKSSSPRQRFSFAERGLPRSCPRILI